jgi:hypothetical protein
VYGYVEEDPAEEVGSGGDGVGVEAFEFVGWSVIVYTDVFLLHEFVC